MQFDWDADKDLMIRSRPGGDGIGFDDIVTAIENGGILANMPNSTVGCTDQYVFIVNVQGYTYKVPYRMSEDCIFLITAFLSRKHKNLIN